MSIGKSSIARAVNATATTTKPQNTNNQNTSINKFSIESIGLLSIAKTSDELSNLKTSVEKRGILCPVLVAVTAKGDVWLVDGYSRVEVAKQLNIEQIDAIVIKVDNKTQANNLYNEINKIKTIKSSNNIHEEKFRVLCVKDHDLPAYLL